MFGAICCSSYERQTENTFINSSVICTMLERQTRKLPELVKDWSMMTKQIPDVCLSEG